MTGAELDHFRQKLDAMARSLRADRDSVQGEALRSAGGEASGNLSNAPMHLADLGTDNYEQEISLGLLESTQATLREVADALQRIDNGTFGRCQECDCEISRERLEVLPHTPFCVECADRLEREGARPM